jgi:hypothetical protein
MVASSYPLLDAFWTMLMFAGFFLWVWVAVAILLDIFRSGDMGGFQKALWVLLIFILPLIGVLIYLIARGGKMARHARELEAAAEEASRSDIKSVASEG